MSSNQVLCTLARFASLLGLRAPGVERRAARVHEAAPRHAPRAHKPVNQKKKKKKKKERKKEKKERKEKKEEEEEEE